MNIQFNDDVFSSGKIDFLQCIVCREIKCFCYGKHKEQLMIFVNMYRPMYAFVYSMYVYNNTCSYRW